MLDVLIVIVIAGGLISGFLCLLAGIFSLMTRIQNIHISRKHKEAIDGIKLFRMVDQRVSALTVSEYDEAIKYTIRKYHLEDYNGAFDFHGQDIEYISILISEAVQQTRLFQSTLAIAQADNELNPKTDREMEVITA